MPLPPCLIFGDYALRPTDGGPSGFLAQNIVGHSSEWFTFSTERFWARWSRSQQVRDAIRGEPLRTARSLGLPEITPLAREMIAARANFTAQAAGRYECIWFHDVARLIACSDLVRPGQRVILQSHCPEHPSKDLEGFGGQPVDVEWLRLHEGEAF